MAQRRMLNIDLILDDSFTQDLSLEAQTMYLYLNMLADDDGIINHLNRKLRMLGKVQTPVDELISAGFISRYDDQTIFITDWLVNNHLRKDRYSQSKASECRDALYINYDWKYTLDANNAKVVIKYSKWIEQDRKIADKPINKLSLIDMKELAEYNYQKRIKDAGDQVVTSTAPSGNQSVTEWLPLGIGKGKGKGEGKVSVKGTGKGEGTKYINSGSKGGMGETLTTTVSTSTMYNNATKESGVDSGVKDSSTTDTKYFSPLTEIRKSDIKDTKDLFSYLTSVIKIDNIPNDHKRMLTLFDDLSNKYKLGYIANAIDLIATDLQGSELPYATVENMVVNHLADKIKEVTTGDDR